MSIGSGVNVFGGLRYTRFKTDYALRLSGTIVADRSSDELLGYQIKPAEFRDRGLATDYSYQGIVAGVQFHF